MTTFENDLRDLREIEADAIEARKIMSEPNWTRLRLKVLDRITFLSKIPAAGRAAEYAIGCVYEALERLEEPRRIVEKHEMLKDRIERAQEKASKLVDKDPNL